MSPIDVSSPKRQPLATYTVDLEPGYSSYWRRATSPVEPIELTHLLIALRKISRMIGKNSGEVIWSGMRAANAITLDPRPLLGQSPVPAHKTDTLVGQVIHEALANKCWSAMALEQAQELIQPAPQYQQKFHFYLQMCERVYLDLRAGRNVYGHYARVSRQQRIRDNMKRLMSPPTVSELMHLWWYGASEEAGEFRHRPDTIGRIVDREVYTTHYAKAESVLDRLREGLMAIIDTQGSVLACCEHRAAIYREQWPDFIAITRFWVLNDADETLIPSIDRDDPAADEADAGMEVLIDAYAQYVERAIDHQGAGSNQVLRQSVQDSDDLVRVEFGKAYNPAHDLIDRKTLYRLEHVLHSLSRRTSHYNRGLRSGHIDGKRLYRAATTGAVFQEKKHRFELHHQFTLLIDATGSMADPVRWDRAQVIYQTLFYALNRYTSSTRLFAYHETNGTCRISDLFYNGRILSVHPSGRTASGEALITAAMQSPQGKRGSVLLHLTDGASNWGCGVGEALTFCRSRNIKLLTLGIDCSTSTKAALAEEYSANVQFLDHVEQLPDTIRTLAQKIRVL